MMHRRPRQLRPHWDLRSRVAKTKPDLYMQVVRMMYELIRPFKHPTQTGRWGPLTIILSFGFKYMMAEQYIHYNRHAMAFVYVSRICLPCQILFSCRLHLFECGRKEDVSWETHARLVFNSSHWMGDVNRASYSILCCCHSLVHTVLMIVSADHVGFSCRLGVGLTRLVLHSSTGIGRYCLGQ